MKHFNAIHYFYFLLFMVVSCSNETSKDMPVENIETGPFKVVVKSDKTIIEGVNTPMGLNIDRFGNLYVAVFSSENKQGLYKFNNSLKYVGELAYVNTTDIGWTTAPNGHFLYKPHSIDFDGTDNLYVNDYGLKKVFKFSYQGKLKATYDEKLYGPATAYFGKNNDLYISEYSSNAVIVCSKDFKYKKSIKNNFDRLHCVSFDATNNMYIADCWNHRILKYDRNDNYIGWLGMKTNGTLTNGWQIGGSAVKSNSIGAFENPIAFSIKNNVLYVLEWGNGRIQKFSLNGKYLGSISNGYSRPYDFKIYNNKLYVTDTDRNRIVISDLP